MALLRYKDNEGNWINITSAQGIQGIQGIQGNQGEQGLSSYEVWLQQPGNSGKTERFYRLPEIQCRPYNLV